MRKFDKNPAGTPQDMLVLSQFLADEKKRTDAGRAWKAEELRLKSHDDLHKLWYIFLQEKNKLKSDLLTCVQMGQVFYGYDNLFKTRKSMARLLTVVNERKKLRNEYRKHLEDRYISIKKKEELDLKMADPDRKDMTVDEIKAKLYAESNAKRQKINFIR